ncbi:unnamed protein product [Ilex paraguariensis]|uniref:GDSL esterase/lipase n=1 Tax=Ilex paraguariensis TaxID=185542 RepID=A0ABC8SCQ8_9AQUA
MASETRNPILLRLCFMVLLISLCLFTASSAHVKGCPFDSIYTFGDGGASTSGSGDLHMVDHLVSAFHLPSPKPYSKEDGKYLSYGANFAAPGAFVMSPRFFVERAIQPPALQHSLRAQVESFKKLLDSTCSSDHGCSKRLHRALFFVDRIGINDYNHAFLEGKSIEEVSRYVPLVSETIKDTLRQLINAGATNLFVSGSLPVGCFPGYLTLFRSEDQMHYDAHKCRIGLNTFATLHNDHLRQALFELRMEFPRVQIVYLDYFKAFMAILRNHDILGFKKNYLMNACCGTGAPYNFNPSKMCGDQGVRICSDPESYLHWDGFHMTQEASRNVVDTLMSRRGFVYPEFKSPAMMHCIM